MCRNEQLTKDKVDNMTFSPQEGWFIFFSPEN